jgi:hypothetical protein
MNGTASSSHEFELFFELKPPTPKPSQISFFDFPYITVQSPAHNAEYVCVWLSHCSEIHLPKTLFTILNSSIEKIHIPHLKQPHDKPQMTL